jgi:putative endonuclease
MDSGHEKGRAGEDLAARFLQERGLRVIERNFRCPIGEIDIVCHEGDIVVFVEVKSRSGASFGMPQEAVSWSKQKRLTRLALWYLKEHRLERRRARFDVVAIRWRVSEPPQVEWFANAFEAAAF